MNHTTITTQIEQELSELPMNMSMADVAKFLGVCLATAYKIAKDNDFPKMKIPGRRLVIVPKHLFFDWYRKRIGDIMDYGVSKAQ